MSLRTNSRTPSTHTRARVGVFGYFATSGFIMGCWAAGLPALDERLVLGPARLGNVLLLIAAGALVSMMFVGRACDRFTSRTVTRICGPVTALALLGPAFADDYTYLAIAAVLYGATVGGIEVSMNVNSIEVETYYARPIVSSFHGFWSLGGAVGGGLTAAGNHLELDPQYMLAGGAVLAAVLFGVFGRMLSPPPPTTDTGTTGAGGMRWGVVLLLGIVAFGAHISEGAAIDWAGVHARQVLAVDLAVAPIAYTVFSVAMTTVRLLGDPIRARLGSERTLFTAGTLATVGYGLVLLAPTAADAAMPVASIGWFCAGAGLATMIPVIFSAVGSGAGSVGRALSTVTVFGSAGLLIGPAAIGHLAEASSLPTALVVPALLAAMVAVTGPPAVRALTRSRHKRGSVTDGGVLHR